MIALAPIPNCPAPVPPGRPESSTHFLTMLPQIRRVARHAFRRMARDCREDAIQEVIANCFVAYARLVERGREQYAFATPLARFAVRHYRDGRRVGSSANCHDV